MRVLVKLMVMATVLVAQSGCSTELEKRFAEAERMRVTAANAGAEWLQTEELIELFLDNREAATIQPAENQEKQKDGELAVFESPKLEKHSDMREFLLVDPIHHVDDRGWPHKGKK